MQNIEICVLNGFYGKLLTDKQREMLELFNDFDLSLAEIAEQFGVSRQAVRDSIQRAEKALLEFEEKLGFAKQKQIILEIIQESQKDLNLGNVEKAKANLEEIKSILEE